MEVEMDEYNEISAECQKIIDFLNAGKPSGLFTWRVAFFRLVGNLYTTLNKNGYKEENFIDEE